jgi:hypothetical protein
MFGGQLDFLNEALFGIARGTSCVRQRLGKIMNYYPQTSICGRPMLYKTWVNSNYFLDFYL